MTRRLIFDLNPAFYYGMKKIKSLVIIFLRDINKMKITHIALFDQTKPGWQVYQPTSYRKGFFSFFWPESNPISELQNECQPGISCIGNGRESNGGKPYSYHFKSYDGNCLIVISDTYQALPEALFNRIWTDLLEEEMEPMTILDDQDNYLSEDYKRTYQASSSG